MPTRRAPLATTDGAIARLALDLRRLRSSAPPGRSQSVDAVAGRSDRRGVSRAAIFAAMRGKVLPSRQTIAAMVQAWSPDFERDLPHWMARRDDCEAELVGGRRTAQGRPAGDGVAGQPGEFGAELRRRREEAGISLAALAKVLHYSKGHMSKVENGHLPPTSIMARLADGFLNADGALVAHAAAVRGDEERFSVS